MIKNTLKMRETNGSCFTEVGRSRGALDFWRRYFASNTASICPASFGALPLLWRNAVKTRSGSLSEFRIELAEGFEKAVDFPGVSTEIFFSGRPSLSHRKSPQELQSRRVS